MYNLFVSGGDSAWQAASYSLPTDRFCEYTDDDIRSRFELPLSEEKRRELETFPCLFAYEGLHDVHVGQLIAITTNEGRLKVRFKLSQVAIPAETFDGIRHQLDIENDWELNRTHWAIKDVVLSTVLEGARVELPDFLNRTDPASDQAMTAKRSELPQLNVEFLKRRASGAFGTVWEAREALLERRIAVKFLTSTDEAYDEAALLKEARNLARISHPSLVTVLGAARLRHPVTRLPAPAILMEYLDGPDLDDWWNLLRDPEQVLRAAGQLVEGVLAMHNGKLVHGDLHPKNVLILDGGWPKIIDWRYQDSGWVKPTSYARNELDAEVRRVYDLVDSLFSKQNVEVSIGRPAAGKGLADLRLQIRAAEARLVNLSDYSMDDARATFRNKAVAAVAQYIYSSGPENRHLLQTRHEEMGLTRTGTIFAIDTGLDDRVFEEVQERNEEGISYVIALTAQGRAILRSSLTDELIYLPKREE